MVRDLYIFLYWFRRNDIFTGESNLMDSLKLKTAFYFTSRDWSRVDYWDVFIICLDSHSDGTHSLQRIHWWAIGVMLNLFKSVLMKKQTHLHIGWPEGEYICRKKVNLVVNYSFKISTDSSFKTLKQAVLQKTLSSVIWSTINPSFGLIILSKCVDDTIALPHLSCQNCIFNEKTRKSLATASESNRSKESP